MGVGFIKDKLEIKFLILYIMSRIIEPLPLHGIQELTMIDDGVDYFAFSECLNDLVQTDHLALSSDGIYSITPKGLKNSEICQSSLPYSVRLKAENGITVYNNRLLRANQVQGKIIPRDNGTYTVDLSLSDDVDNVLHLQLLTATEDMAKDLTDRFKKDPEQLYTKLLSALFTPDEP